FLSFFLTDPPPPHTFPLSLHDALPISLPAQPPRRVAPERGDGVAQRQQRPAAERGPGEQRRERGDADDERGEHDPGAAAGEEVQDRKSTRLNSSHVKISYAVFCLKKKK